MDFSALSVFDYIVISVVAISTIVAFSKGFLKTVLSLIVWIGAVILSFYLVPYVQPIVAQNVESAMSVAVLSFSLAIIVSFVGLLLLTIPINTILSPIAQGFMDRTLGFAFGLLRGLFLVCIFFTSIVLLDVMVNGNEEEQEKGTEAVTGDVFIDQVISNRVGPLWLQEAQTYSIMRVGSRFLLDLLPNDIFDNAGKALEDLRKDKEGSDELLDSTGKDPAKQMLDIIGDVLESDENEEKETSEKDISESLRGILGDKPLQALKKEWKNPEKNGKNKAPNEGDGYDLKQLEQLDGLIETLE